MPPTGPGGRSTPQRAHSPYDVMLGRARSPRREEITKTLAMTDDTLRKTDILLGRSPTKPVPRSPDGEPSVFCTLTATVGGERKTRSVPLPAVVSRQTLLDRASAAFVCGRPLPPPHSILQLSSEGEWVEVQGDVKLSDGERLCAVYSPGEEHPGPLPDDVGDVGYTGPHRPSKLLPPELQGSGAGVDESDVLVGAVHVRLHAFAAAIMQQRLFISELQELLRERKVTLSEDLLRRSDELSRNAVIDDALAFLGRVGDPDAAAAAAEDGHVLLPASTPHSAGPGRFHPTEPTPPHARARAAESPPHARQHQCAPAAESSPHAQPPQRASAGAPPAQAPSAGNSRSASPAEPAHADLQVFVRQRSAGSFMFRQRLLRWSRQRSEETLELITGDDQKPDLSIPTADIVHCGVYSDGSSTLMMLGRSFYVATRTKAWVFVAQDAAKLSEWLGDVSGRCPWAQQGPYAEPVPVEEVG